VNGLRRVLLLAALALIAGPAQAMTCSITAAPTPLDFGTYTVLAQSTANVVFTYTCTRTVAGDSTGNEPWRIRLDTGGTSGAGGYANRTLFNGATNALLYNIYTEAAFTNIFGDTTGGTAQAIGIFNFAGVPVGGSVSTTVTGYGRIVANQDLDAGIYQTSTPITATARLSTGPPVIVTTTFGSRANLAANCMFDAAPNIPFGVYNPLAPGDVDLSPSLETRCTRNTNYTISLSTGAGSYAMRKMDSAGANTDQLSYNIFTPAGFTTVWGDGSGGSSAVSGVGTGMLLAQKVTRVINARLFAGQDLSADTYADTITITISY
jgi:spore coat protein U-like protein